MDPLGYLQISSEFTIQTHRSHFGVGGFSVTFPVPPLCSSLEQRGEQGVPAGGEGFHLGWGCCAAFVTVGFVCSG